MEQVLVLNGLNGQVDTRGTSASCAQSPDGTVSCMDTPLGAAAARAAEVGGDVGAYAASRLDVLAQSARAESTEAEQRADGLEADASSARRIGKQGSADQLDRAVEAARLQARAALAQSAAAAAAAQAVRIGDARRALMAADAVVAAAWRSDLAEVQAGALMGLELGVAGDDALELRQGYPQDVPGVARFTIADPGVVKGQIIGTKLVLVGVKGGVTSVEAANAAGARREIKVTVKALIPAEQMALAQETFDQIKALTSSPAALKIDWQDADVLRANYDLIYPVLRRIRNAVTDAPLFRPQEFQSNFLIEVLNTARSNPQLKTLRDVVLAMRPKLTSLEVPEAADFRRRECTRNSVTNVVFHDLYTFTRDYHTAGKITNVILTIADVVGKIYSMVDPATGKIIADSSKAARAVAAPALAEYGADPKRLVSGFGNAVCVAITGGVSALPVAARAALSLRATAISEARRYRASLLLANDTRRPAERRAESAAAAQGQKLAAQDALAKLVTLDVPSAFTAAQNAELEEARATVNADTSLAPGGASTGGGGGAIVAVGAAAAAFALWRFLR
jgi:hypothetical protein